MISIPKPCPESWEKMAPKEHGRHCDVCCKVVVDFTKCSNAEIVNYLSLNSNRKTCGRFRKEQLGNSVGRTSPNHLQPATRNTHRFTRFLAAIALVFGFSLFTSCGPDDDDHVVGDVAMDSATEANNIARFKADSTHRADSLATHNIPEENKLSKEDSSRVADSLAKHKNSVRDFE